MSVYFVRGEPDGPIKIGNSTDPEQRLAGLRPASPMPLVLLRVEDGDNEREAMYHAWWASSRLHFEWFAPASSLVTYARTGEVDALEVVSDLVGRPVASVDQLTWGWTIHVAGGFLDVEARPETWDTTCRDLAELTGRPFALDSGRGRRGLHDLLTLAADRRSHGG